MKETKKKVKTITPKQEKYIETICNYLGWEKPKIFTKEKATQWLNENISEYHWRRDADAIAFATRYDEWSWLG